LQCLPQASKSNRHLDVTGRSKSGIRIRTRGCTGTTWLAVLPSRRRTTGFGSCSTRHLRQACRPNSRAHVRRGCKDEPARTRSWLGTAARSASESFTSRIASQVAAHLDGGAWGRTWRISILERRSCSCMCSRNQGLSHAGTACDLTRLTLARILLRRFAAPSGRGMDGSLTLSRA